MPAKAARASRLRVLAASRRQDGKDHGAGRPRKLAGETPALLFATCRANRSSQYAGFALACATVVSSVSARAWVKNAAVPGAALTLPAKAMQ